MIYIIHKILVQLKNYLNYFKDSILECFLNNVIEFFLNKFVPQPKIMENLRLEEENITDMGRKHKRYKTSFQTKKITLQLKK